MATKMAVVPSFSQSGRGRSPPFRDHIIRRQCVAWCSLRSRCAGVLSAADRAGMVRRLFVGDDLVQFARALLGAMPDHGRGLAADFAGLRLALAELAHV